MRYTRLLQHADYFRILNLESDATDTDVKMAYLREAKKWHPDTNTNSKTDAINRSSRFQLVGEAYSHLKTAESRAAYRFEISPDAAEDWTQRGRKDSQFNQRQQETNSVQYEFNAAEQRWQHANANSKSARFAKAFEKVIHPRNLFFVLPLGIIAYWFTTTAIDNFKENHVRMLPGMVTAGLSSTSESGVNGDGDGSDGGKKVLAWHNPRS